MPVYQVNPYDMYLPNPYARHHQLHYTLCQIEGQKYARLIDNMDLCSPQHFEVYVSNLPRNVEIETLLHYFTQCGIVQQLRLLMDFSGWNRGQCFVLYKSIRACRQAICCLHDEVLFNHVISVRLSLNNNKLLIRGIPSWVSDKKLFYKQLRGLFGRALRKIFLKDSHSTPTKYCICEFTNHQRAALTHKKFWPYFSMGSYQMLELHWATPTVVQTSKSLYFTNVPAMLTKKLFFDALAKQLDLKLVVNIQFYNNITNGRITFINMSALENSEKKLHGLQFGIYFVLFSRTPIFPKTSHRRMLREVPLQESV